jgi:hypothetical protein
MFYSNWVGRKGRITSFNNSHNKKLKSVDSLNSGWVGAMLIGKKASELYHLILAYSSLLYRANGMN